MRAPKLADIVARNLRAWIVRRVLKEGDLLPRLDRLAARFGVSLQVVREAIRILETEDLLEVRRGHVGGVAVKAPTLEVTARSIGVYLQYNQATVDDVLTARMVIEPFAAARLAANPTPDIVSALDELIRRAEACQDSSRSYAVAAMAIHQALVALAGNKTLTMVHAAVVQTVRNNIADLESREPLAKARRQAVLKSYDRLLSLIRKGDVAGAEQHMRKHLEASAKALFDHSEGGAVIDLFPAPDEAPPTAELVATPSPPAPRGRAAKASSADGDLRKPRARRRS
jgi:DNA-binding FadR family transcriptional regulator